MATIKALTDKEYERIQSRELGYWKHTQYSATGPWKHYDKAFQPWIDEDLGMVADVGSGPVPYFLGKTYYIGMAIDPLVGKYMELERYRIHWRGQNFEWLTDISQVSDGENDTVFALNVLDHARFPARLISEIARILRQGGRLFLYVDIDKPPDPMHPHMLTQDWVATELFRYFTMERVLIEPSWKFKNPIMFYVGRKR